MQEKKLPSKRLICFSKANEDVNRYLQELIDSEKDFNLSIYICQMIREVKMNRQTSNQYSQDEWKALVKEALIEALEETDFDVKLKPKDATISQEELEDRLTQLMNL